MQSNNAVNVLATLNAPVVLRERHGHGEHAVYFPFDVKATGAHSFFVRVAAEQTQLVKKLRGMVEAIGDMALSVHHDNVALTVAKKGDFPVAAAIMQTMIGTLTPAEFAAEVAEALPAVVARHEAAEQARVLRKAIVDEARKSADEALAAEIADLKARVDALAAKHAALCTETVQAKLADDATFAGQADAALVREEAQASFARVPADFGGRFAFKA